MSTSLVLGTPYSGRSRYAQSVLARHRQVSVITADTNSDIATGIPEHWTTTHTADWRMALMTARVPVLLGPVDGWLTGVLTRFDEHRPVGDPLPAEQRLVRTAVHDQLDELLVILTHMPYEAVIVGSEDLGHRGPGTAFRRELLGEVNARLSTSVQRVHLVVAGRVLDLSQAPIIRGDLRRH